jgi:hypothetical protein
MRRRQDGAARTRRFRWRPAPEPTPRGGVAGKDPEERIREKALVEASLVFYLEALVYPKKSFP